MKIFYEVNASAVNQKRPLTQVATAVSLIVLFGICRLSVGGQVTGCRDPLATNYNASATATDSSCIYSITNYSPPVKVDPLDPILWETSALQMAGNSLWTLNDKNGQPAIYRIDTLTNAILQTVTIGGATNDDWEELTFDGTNFYIGDFGNNADGGRTNLKIYKFPLALIPAYQANPTVTIPAGLVEIINYTYADQPQPPIPGMLNATRFDCEALVVDNGKIHLFSKNWIDFTSTHYVINGMIAGTYIASPLETLATGFLVTGCSRAPGQNYLALYGYQTNINATHNIMLLSDYAGGHYFNGNRRRLELPGFNVMGQGEGITFRNGIQGYLSNERVEYFIGPVPFTISSKLRAFDISAFVQVTYAFTGNGAWNVSTNWENSTMPPAKVSPGSRILIDPATAGSCVLNIPYTVASGASLTVVPGKRFVVQADLVISK